MEKDVLTLHLAEPWYSMIVSAEKKIVDITIGKPKKGLCPKEFLNKEYFIIKFK